MSVNQKKTCAVIVLLLVLLGVFLALFVFPREYRPPAAARQELPSSAAGEAMDETLAAEREAALPEVPAISEATWPTVLSNDQFFGLRGNIVCRYPLTEVRGTVTNRVSGEVLFDVSVYPNATSYSVGNPADETINDSLVFNSPKCANSWLNYRLTAKHEKDGETITTVLIDQNFKVGSPAGEPPEE